MKTTSILLSAAIAAVSAFGARSDDAVVGCRELSSGFDAPPKTARPGVYWYFMDGNYSREGVTRDVEAMRDAGIGYVVFLEVNIGIPRGKVELMSDEWIAMFRHIVDECERCDIQIILGIGPGWTGSGGPWVKGEESMRHLVSSTAEVEGGRRVSVALAKPAPHDPFFGARQFPPKMRKDWEDYYEDVCVLAFPASVHEKVSGDVAEKTHVYRSPYSSPGLARPKRGFVRACMEPSVPRAAAAPRAGIDRAKIIDISGCLKHDGTLEWDAPPGRWTVMRCGARNNGAVTRPAPLPGVGMECDKFDDKALASHLSNFTDRLFAAIGPRGKAFGGIKYLHLDSWEMGAQNWTGRFREEFTRRRGYDPKPFYPAISGLLVENEEVTERFLWDLRRTSQELIVENHVGAVKKYARAHGGCLVSCEPYDMNPTADLELACASDVPMAEFWTENMGAKTAYAPIEATSAANLIGQNAVPAESFTASRDAWRPYPGSMKNQTDWALAMGINRLVFHTFQHQCLPESLKPGMTMGPYGVHWDRNQTWWPMVGDGYHRYLARCQFMLQQGRTVADILYLAPENSPHVFLPPASALVNPDAWLPDRRGYNFDGCPPSMLFKASVKDGRVVFPGGAEYRLLVLPDYPTMTPELLAKVRDLVKDGATVAGVPPRAAPGLAGYPECDANVREIAKELWGDGGDRVRRVGKGRVVREPGPDRMYPDYAKTVALLAEDGLLPDFESSSGHLRFIHRTSREWDVYFVASRVGAAHDAKCTFRVSGRTPEVWDAVTGERSRVKFADDGRYTSIDLFFEPNQSLFVVFPGGAQTPAAPQSALPERVVETKLVCEIDGSWKVTFRPPVGKPFTETFAELGDWTASRNDAIKYFSGIATYETKFDAPSDKVGRRTFISFTEVNVMARVWLNGKCLGVLWTYPWRIECTGALKPGVNELKVEVANLWSNRLIGDETLPYDGPVHGLWPDWLLKGEKRPSPRTTFATYRFYSAKSPLQRSGLVGKASVESN